MTTRMRIEEEQVTIKDQNEWKDIGKYKNMIWKIFIYIEINWQPFKFKKKICEKINKIGSKQILRDINNKWAKDTLKF